MGTTIPWTDGRKHSFIVSVLRSGSRRWPPKYETLNEAKTDKKVNKKTGRIAQHYLCSTCNKEYTSKDVQVDHIKPIIDPTIGWVSWDKFVENLYCEKANLQVLCKPCHEEKTKGERDRRKKSNKNK